MIGTVQDQMSSWGLASLLNDPVSSITTEQIDIQMLLLRSV